ncbi:hypothetical protein B0H11DRAFT_2131648 [Mycena galericulata]|nr:hypothetical protein B0H11DRAFT_2131648 [Mycena galericulata]
MMVLLKPWRDMKMDLKQRDESWSQAFDIFTATADKKVHDILAGIQYFHSCRSAALATRCSDEDVWHPTTGIDSTETLEMGEDIECPQATLSEEGLAQLIASQVAPREDLHARMALEHARVAKIFTNDSSDWILSAEQLVVANATGDDLFNLTKWRTQLDNDIAVQNSVPEMIEPADLVNDAADVIQVDHVTIGQAQVTSLRVPASPETALLPAHPSHLKPDQLRAYEIIVWHLDETLAGKEPPPLRMLLHGEGGTGNQGKVTEILVPSPLSYS